MWGVLVKINFHSYRFLIITFINIYDTRCSLLRHKTSAIKHRSSNDIQDDQLELTCIPLIFNRLFTNSEAITIRTSIGTPVTKKILPKQSVRRADHKWLEIRQIYLVSSFGIISTIFLWHLAIVVLKNIK